MKYFTKVLLRLLGLVVLPATGARAQAIDLIRGHISDREKKALPGAEVLVLGDNSTVLQSARFDKNGRYTIVVGEARDSYVLAIRLIGYVPFSMTVHRAALSTVIDVADVALAQLTDSPSTR